MGLFGERPRDHQKRGHHIHPRYKVVTRNGRKVQEVSRMVCDCGRTWRA